MATVIADKYFKYAVIVGFIIIVVGAFYWQVAQREILAAHPANPRTLHQRQWSKRGGIFDAQGEVITDSLEGPVGYSRAYHGTEGLAPTIGYFSLRYGTAGLEKTFDRLLAGETYPGSSLWGQATYGLVQPKNGYDLLTTLDLSLQRQVERVLCHRRSAVVVMEVKTGRIMAVSSLPGFLPGDLEVAWEDISTSSEAPLYNRAFAGFYPPGSTFKLMVLAAVLSQGAAGLDSIFEDNGSVEIQGHRIANADGRRWGSLPLRDAFAVSSNVVFIELGQRVGAKDILDTATKFHIGQTPPLVADNIRPGRLPGGGISSLELAEICIGQHELITTPLQLAMVVQAIANGGLMMEPLLVEGIRDSGSGRVWKNEPRPMGYVVDPKVAGNIMEAMTAVVMHGTGKQAALGGLSVAGKTGSAQNPRGPAHAWFVGAAPAEYPEICLAIIVENGGASGMAAALAGQIFWAYFSGETGTSPKAKI